MTDLVTDDLVADVNRVATIDVLFSLAPDAPPFATPIYATPVWTARTSPARTWLEPTSAAQPCGT